MGVKDTGAFVDRVLLAHHMATAGPDGLAAPCPQIIDWVKAQRGRADTEALRAEFVARPEWQRFRPWWSLRGFRATLGVPGAEEAQLFWAKEISALPFEQLAGNVERIVLGVRDRRHPDRARPGYGHLIGEAAWLELIAWWAAGHPQPKAFFARPDVLDVLPASDAIAAAITALPCGAVRGLEAAALRGRRETVSE